MIEATISDLVYSKESGEYPNRKQYSIHVWVIERPRQKFSFRFTRNAFVFSKKEAFAELVSELKESNNLVKNKLTFNQP